MNSFLAQHRHFDTSLMGLAGVVGCEGEKGPTPWGSGEPALRRGHTQRITRGGGGFGAETKLGAITGAHPKFNHDLDVGPSKLHRVAEHHPSSRSFSLAGLDVENLNGVDLARGQIFFAFETANV